MRGSERFVFLYDDQSRNETLRVLGRFASNPELSFSWYDAAFLSQKIRKGFSENAFFEYDYFTETHVDKTDRWYCTIRETGLEVISS